MTHDLDFKVMVIRPIDALDVLCAQLTRDLFAIAKFLYYMAARLDACLLPTSINLMLHEIIVLRKFLMLIGPKVL